MFRAGAFFVALLCFVSLHAQDAPLQDPMRPFGGGAGGSTAAATARPRFSLTAILVAPARRVAIVNGKAYQQGDAVDGAEVVAIEIDSVRLREAGREHVLMLGGPQSSRRPNVQGETVR